MLFTPKSILYYPEYYTEKYDEKIELSDHIILPAFYIHTLLTRYNEPPYLVKITNTSSDMSYIVSIGTPHMYDKTIVFVPQWILHIIGISDMDDSDMDDSIIRIEKYDEELPVATSITLRPLDRGLFDTNIIECCQQAMLILHTIKKGTIIPIKIPEQNDICNVVIDDLEPGNICRIQEGELAVHFINDFVSIPNPIESIIATEEAIGELSLEEKRCIAREARLKRFC